MPKPSIVETMKRDQLYWKISIPSNVSDNEVCIGETREIWAWLRGVNQTKWVRIETNWAHWGNLSMPLLGRTYMSNPLCKVSIMGQ